MTKVYSVILTPTKIDEEKGFAVYVPDLEINTQGHDMAESIDMARDAIGLWGISMQDDGREIPEPSTTQPKCEANEIVTWVDIDFEKYRKANDMTTMRINVSVPKYLKVLGDESGINFSQELQERLRERLSVS